MTYWNYCDYRCEDCEHLFECPVAAKEREHHLRAVAGGREFDPLEAVRESLSETEEMILKMAEEKGIDLNSLESVDIKERNFPIVEKSKEFAIDVISFAREMEDRYCLGDSQRAIHDLCCYSGLLSAKLFRCISGKYEAMEEDAPELREIVLEDAHKTADVVALSINKCKDALNKLSPEHSSKVNRFSSELKEIEKNFGLEFPEVAIDQKILN